MEYLFKSWKEIVKGFKKDGYILLLLDYDGTLTPIVSRPQDAILDSTTRSLLRALAGKTGIEVGIISGRELKELEGLVGISGLIFAGNHGFQIKGPNLEFIHPAISRFLPTLKKLRNSLKQKLSKIPGVIVEDKKLTLSLHYRMVKRRHLEKVKKIFEETIHLPRKARQIKLTSGKKVWEIRPPLQWHKGKAVELIYELVSSLKRKKPQMVIYIGDDTTDEDAFEVLAERTDGLPIFVGRPKASRAKYFLRNTDEVKDFLGRLLNYT